MGHSVNLANLAAGLGDYHREKQGLKDVEFFSGMQSIEQGGITLETNIRDEEECAFPFIGDILQKGDPDNFNETSNAIDYKTKRWKVRPYKVDLKITPQNFKATWLAGYESPSRNPYNLTKSEYIYNKILQRTKENLERVIWSGQYNAAPNPANVANVLAVNDGFKKQISDAIAGSETIPVATGAITSANAVAKFDQMWETLPEELWYVKSVLYCSPAQALNYIKNYKALNNSLSPNFIKLYDQTRVGLFNTDVNYMRAFTLDSAGDACIVMPMLGLVGSNRLILQTMQAGSLMAVGMGNEADIGSMLIEYRRRNIEIMVDGSIATAIYLYSLNNKKYVLVNDQA